ncbi:hypothetical protein [Aminobacter niigataensis]|uniref:hypothetical protein n=1 Tax=Aminobacter niigataensis TaxID=83265 RepID=UPI0024C919A3|nr:hypothetical protein [Aminobacter niigataensis]CAI2936121.1 conserved protein of unknown function [Aminobacter niigataensis]
MTAAVRMSDIKVPNFMTDGSIMDLADPRAEHIVFAEMANGLSKIARFNGRYTAIAYSVGQHCVMGADALFNETGDTTLAGYFLLHDGHEYLVGDISRPMALLVGLLLGDQLSAQGIARRFAADALRKAIEAAKARIDIAIYQAAGIPQLATMPHYRRVVAEMDERMLVAEARVLYGARAAVPLARNDLPAPKLTGAIKPWGAMKAEEAFADRLERYLGIVARG